MPWGSGRAPSFAAETTVSADQQALRRLGLVASAYLVLLAAVATLAPFELAWPRRWQLDFALRRDDVMLNLLMLLPLGLVSGLGASRRARPLQRGLLLGLGLSLSVELLQLFLPERRANPFDVMANVSGASLGAWLYASQRSWIDARLIAVLRAQPPLAALPIALLPVLWLDGLALYTPARGLLAALLGVAGACVAAATWRPHGHALTLPARIGLWYALGTLPAWLAAPAGAGLPLAFGFGCSVAAAWFLHERPGGWQALPADAQRLALARALPWLAVYLLAVAIWSPPSSQPAPSWTFGFVPLARGSQRTMLAFLEYLAAFTLFGYLHALLLRPAHGRFSRVALHACLLGCGLELLRAAYFGRCASGTAVALLVVAAVSGACLHDAQRELVTAADPEPGPAGTRETAI